MDLAGPSVAVVTGPFPFRGVPPSGGAVEAQAVLPGILQQQQVKEEECQEPPVDTSLLLLLSQRGLACPALESRELQPMALRDHGDG